MLALSRKKNEAIVINNDIEITVLEVKGDQVKIGITAPKEVPIYRKEVYLQIQEANKAAVKSNFAGNMRKRDKTCAKATPEEPKREQRMVCLMSEEEQRIVDRYLEKYKITNKSRWLRETILMFIHKNMEEDYPTLFGEHDMRR